MADTTTSAGIKISISNTPQAISDSYGFSEDQKVVYCLDVMANDLGGTAKTLYSVDDGQNSTTDLLVKDVLIGDASLERSLEGARLWITSEGTVAYDTSTINSKLQALAEGETFKDSFSYAIRLGNGTLSWSTVAITITGTNDAPTVAAALTATAAEGDVAFTKDLLAGATDVDHGETATLSVAGVSYSVNGGAASTTAPAGVSLSGNTLSVDPTNAAFNSLAVNEKATIVVSYQVKDAQGATVNQTETITITGSNDVVSITSDVQTGSVTEDVSAAHMATGSIAFTDVDLSDSHTAAVTTAPTAALGTFALASVNEAANAASGTVGWTYTLDDSKAQYLAAGQQVMETYTVTLDDKNGSTTTQNVTITITGSNDVVSITSDAQAGSVTEDVSAAHMATGSIAFTDVDLSDSHTAAAAAATGNTTALGTFALAAVSEAANAASGTVGWTYTLDDSKAQYLAAGQQVTETYTVTLDDKNGSTTTQNVTITITGSNDVVSITSDAQAGLVTEDVSAAHMATGSIAFTDVDLSDSHTAAVTTAPTAALGTFALASVNEAANAASGTVGWTYTLDDSKAQYLAAGQQVMETYTVTLDDKNGSTTTQNVTITITGSNDVVSITSDAQAGSVTEDVSAAHMATGSIAFTDVDLSDSHTAAVTTAPTAALGTFALAAVSEAANAASGTVGWTYTLDDSKAQYLAAGQQVTETYTVTLDDKNGSTTTQNVTITITGTNDAPTVAAALTATAAEGDVAFTKDLLAGATDVDHGETATLSVAGVSYSVNSGAASTTAPAGVSLSGSTLSVDPTNAAFNSLAVNEKATIVVSYQVKDAQGATVNQTETITITGTNDAPGVSGAVTGTATEDSVVSTLNALANASDVDHGTTLQVVNVPATANLPAGVTYDAATHSFTLNPADQAYQSLAANETTTVTVSYGVSDGTVTTPASVSWTVTGANDAPTAQADTASVKEDTLPNPISGNVLVNDNDADATDTHSVIAINGNAALVGSDVAGKYGTLHLNADGSYSYTLDNTKASVQALTDGQTVQDLFDYTNGDNHGGSSSATLTVTVSGTNEVVSGVAATDLKFNALPVTGNGIGSTLGTFIFADPDGGAAAHTYSLVADPIFKLDQNSGALSAGSLANSTDYKLDVTVSQAGATSYTETFHIITGSNDADPQLTGTSGTSAVNGSDVIYAQGKGDIIFALGGDDTVFGQQDDDQIHGGNGNDILYGGGGSDTFFFDTALNRLTNVDQIQDFSIKDHDVIALSSSIFAGIANGTNGVLNQNDFASVTGSGDTSEVGSGVNIIYDQSTGNLFYDADGGSAAGRTQFAHLTIDGGGTFDVSSIKVVS